MRSLIIVIAVALVAGCSEFEPMKEIKPLDFKVEKDATWLTARLNKADVKGDFEKDIIKCLEASKGNWPVIADTLKAVKDDELKDLCELLAWMPPLSLIEAKQDALVEHVRESQAARKAAKWQIEQGDYEDFILNPTIIYEAFCPWRKKISTELGTLRKDDALQTAKALNEWIANYIRTYKQDDISIYGWPKSPAEVLSSKCGTESEITIFTIAALRTFAVPARLHNAGWVEFKHKGEWLPLYPLKPENIGKKNVDPEISRQYAQTGKVIVNFIKNGQPASEFQDFSIMRTHEAGVFVRVNPEETADKSGIARIDLPPGDYRLIIGVRSRSGDIYMHHKRFTLESGKQVAFVIALDIPIEQWAKEEWLVRPAPALKGIELKVLNMPDNEKKTDVVKLDEFIKSNCSVLYLFRFDNEASTRILPGLKSFALDGRGNVMMVHIGEKTAAVDKFIAENPTIPVAMIEDKVAIEKLTLPYAKESSRFTQLPSVMLYKKGQLMLWAEGFQDNLEKLLDAAKERK